jgi:hypothetical protein
LFQLESWVKQEIAKGKGEQHTNHVAIIEEAAEQRAKNEPDAEGKRKTRIAWDAADPDSYMEWHKERERWMKILGNNPTTTTDCQIVALKAYSEEGIMAIRDAINETRAKTNAPV